MNGSCFSFFTYLERQKGRHDKEKQFALLKKQGVKITTPDKEKGDKHGK